MAKISVIMPVYNGARFVAEAIESLLAQTWQDWELIVIDDGSTDSTPSILKGFSDPRIVIIHQKNQGAAVARNVGLGTAQGEYVAFLDADDLYLPNALTDYVSYLVAHPEHDVVFADGYFCDASGKPLMRLTEHRPGIHTGFILEQVVLSPDVITFPVCTLTRRSAIETQEVRFDSQLAPSEDWDFWIQLARQARFGYLDKLTCFYRVHQTNITRTTGRKKRRDDLVHNRLKVLKSDWFQELSIITKCEFSYNLLVNLLSGEPGKQREVLRSDTFLNLPDPQRARILRLVATAYLLQGKEPEFARKCLEQSLSAWRADRNSQILIRLMDLGLPVCRSVLLAWQALRRTRVKLLSIGRHSPKPVPIELTPASNE